MDYCFYSLSIPIEGFLRTAVYDLQTNDYFFVNNGIQEMVINTEESETIQQLIKERAIFEKPRQVAVSPISIEEYDYPSLVSNAIIEVDGSSTITELLNRLEMVNCYNVQWVYKGQSKDLYQFLENSINEIRHSPIKYCEIVLNEKDFNNVRPLLTRKGFPELGLIFLHSANSCSYLTANSERPHVICFDSDGSYDTHQYDKSIHFFVVNYLLYTESLRYNSYYNRKIFINLQGDVSVGPLSNKFLGNLYEQGFDWNTVLKQKDIKVIWELHKDKISVCKNCEFRHMCVDSRIPKKHSDGTEWYHNTECNYNPFIAKWKGEQGYKTLSESGIKVEEKGLSIDYEILNSVLSELYM